MLSLQEVLGHYSARESAGSVLGLQVVLEAVWGVSDEGCCWWRCCGMVLGGAVDSQDDTKVRGTVSLHPCTQGPVGMKKLGHKPQQGSAERRIARHYSFLLDQTVSSTLARQAGGNSGKRKPSPSNGQQTCGRVGERMNACRKPPLPSLPGAWPASWICEFNTLAVSP